MKPNNKIAFFEMEGWEEEMIRKEFPDSELLFSKDKLDEDHMPENKDWELISIFVNSHITDKILKQLPRLKFITTRSTGFDHIDLKSCRKHKVMVSLVPGYGVHTVAEFAFGMLLSLTRKIYSAIDQIKETGLFSLSGLRGVDLKGKTMGIVGTGRVGKEAVRIAKGFGMNVIAYDPYPDEKFGQETGLKYVSLEELLKNADAISLHVPYNKDTHHLINKKNIQRIKKGAYLVNTARGGIVETEALTQALEQGILAGAALDVLEEEGEVKDELAFLSTKRPNEHELKIMLENHILMKMPNVLITPHNAFNTKEALERILQTTIDNLKGFVAGNPINIAKG